MTEERAWFKSLVPDDAVDLPDIDTSVAHPARMYDFYLGGKTHFAADRKAAGQVLSVLPEGRDMAMANRAFLGRAVRFLAGNGISQFLDIGTGIPSPGSTGEIIHGVSPGLVQLPFWRPEGGETAGDPEKIWLYAGVGRKG